MKVLSVFSNINGQVNIEIINLQTGKSRWFQWDKYPGQLPKVGEEF
jgi:hypothetical protein